MSLQAKSDAVGGHATVKSSPHRFSLRKNRSASSLGFPLGKPNPQGGSELQTRRAWPRWFCRDRPPCLSEVPVPASANCNYGDGYIRYGRPRGADPTGECGCGRHSGESRNPFSPFAFLEGSYTSAGDETPQFIHPHPQMDSGFRRNDGEHSRLVSFSTNPHKHEWEDPKPVMAGGGISRSDFALWPYLL